MIRNIIIRIENVEEGENDNWLKFKSFVGYYEKNKVYTIDFCGTEVNSEIPLTDEQNNALKKLLTNDFGYAPYNKNEAKKIIGEGKEYIIEITD